jgi:pyruvate,orthophosphate dikinase
MIAADGIVTAKGGATSHAAVVARAFDTPCVVGCSELDVDIEGGRFGFAGQWFDEGCEVAIDGATGEVFGRALPLSSTDRANADLGALLCLADKAAGCVVYGRATTVEQVDKARERGAAGIAMRLGDLLATTGELAELQRLLVAQWDTDSMHVEGFEDVVADVLTPVLEAAGEMPFAVRAVDFVADDFTELLDAGDLIERQPRLGLPVAIPEMLAAQLAGLSIAAARVGGSSVPQLSVRHVCDPGEAAEIKRIASTECSRPGRAQVRVGATLTSPRAVHRADDIAPFCDGLWLEVRGLQAAVFGYHPRVLQSTRPLDDYVRRRMLGRDPRTTLDALTLELIGAVATAREHHPACEIGVRLAGPVTGEMITPLYQAGFRTYAVDDGEIRPARLSLGQAAYAATAGVGESDASLD